MSKFFTCFLVRTTKSEEQVARRFPGFRYLEGSDWILGSYGGNLPVGLFEAGSCFTKGISAEFGEAVFACQDERDDQMEYEHSVNGKIVRKLSWISDGNESTWQWVEGTREDWEDRVLFSDDNFARATEPLRYDEDLSFVTEEEYQRRLAALSSDWEQRRYSLGGKCPHGDGTIASAILKHYGLRIPS